MRYPVRSILNAEEGDATPRIQSAIDAAAAAGNGTVILAPGRHAAGGLRLASCVDLVLEEGAVLAASTDYEAFAGNTLSVIAEDSDRAFLLASGVHDAGVFGPGCIDAGSDSWSQGWDDEIGTLVPAKLRPRPLAVEASTRVTLKGFRIEKSPMWTVHLIGSSELRVEGVVIDNDIRLPNSDGIVVDSCTDVEVVDCSIRTADDGVCLKTSLRRDGQPVGPCRNVRVERCKVSTRSCAFKIGTETHADVSDVLFVDCVAEDSNRGIGVISRDGGSIQRVRFERIRIDCRETPVGFWGSGEGVTITALDRRASKPAGDVREIVVTGLSGRAEGATVLYSERMGMVSEVLLKDVDLEQSPGVLDTARMLDLRPTAADLKVPEGAEGRANSWVRLQDGSIAGLQSYPGGLPGLYAYGIDGLRLESVRIRRPDPLPEGWNATAVWTEAAGATPVA
jgi:hypothetical protein